MAAKRISKSSINWAALVERVPKDQKTNLHSFKTKNDIYVRAMLANPDTPPKIDWDYYKKLIPISGLVDNFKKQYESITIPYPPDNVTKEVEAQTKETKADIEAFKKESLERIAEFEKQIGHLKSVLPYEEMTMEDYRDAFPEAALNPIDRPTFWPHSPEDQLGYVSKDAAPLEEK